MEDTYLLSVEGVKKKILHGGSGQLPDFKDGSKVTFHFQTLKDDFERTVIDDSRVAGVPMEIVLGKMFKIEVWEILLTSMRIGEVAEFWCDTVHTGMYALISKGIRRIAEGKDPLEGQKHQCGMGNMLDYHSTGYADLDELQRLPQPLIFIMELLKVEDPSSYKRDTWAMNKTEQLMAVPKLHAEGNRLVLSRRFKEAAEKYQEAIVCLRNIQAKEKPGDEAWLRLENLAVPLVLNYCQCQLELGEYYEVLEHTTDLLQKNNENVKAYFKRAKAQAAVWNEKEARADFLRVAHLDPSLAAAVRKELKLLEERIRQKHVDDRKRYQRLFQQPAAKGKTVRGEAEGSSGKSKGLSAAGVRAEMEESKQGILKAERGEGSAGVAAKNGETEQGNIGEEKKSRLIKEGERDDTEVCAAQKVWGELVIVPGNKEHEHPKQGKVYQSFGDEEAIWEMSGPKPQSGYGEGKPKEKRVNTEGIRQNEVGFATLKEEQGKGGVLRNSGKEVEETVGHPTTGTGKGVSPHDFATEASARAERESKARCGKEAAEWSLRKEAISVWDRSEWPKEVSFIGKKEECKLKTKMGKGKTEADDHSKLVEMHGYETRSRCLAAKEPGKISAEVENFWGKSRREEATSENSKTGRNQANTEMEQRKNGFQQVCWEWPKSTGETAAVDLFRGFGIDDAKAGAIEDGSEEKKGEARSCQKGQSETQG